MRREASVDTRSIIQRVTVLTPSTIKGNSYNCVILGDGKKQHYGIDNT